MTDEERQRLIENLLLMADAHHYGPLYKGAADEIERLGRLLKIRDRQTIQNRAHWVRAAKLALEGSPQELRNRIEMAEADPVELVET
jgi:hypothetical protein